MQPGARLQLYICGQAPDTVLTEFHSQNAAPFSESEQIQAWTPSQILLQYCASQSRQHAAAAPATQSRGRMSCVRSNHRPNSTTSAPFANKAGLQIARPWTRFLAIRPAVLDPSCSCRDILSYIRTILFSLRHYCTIARLHCVQNTCTDYSIIRADY